MLYGFYLTFAHRLPYKPYTKSFLIYTEDFYVPSKEDSKTLIKRYYNVLHIYIDKELGATTGGFALCMPPIVMIDDDLNGVSYITTYVHELMHIKYQTTNERFVVFMTFKTMYESGSDVLRNCSMELAYMVVSGAYEREYDCGYYILEYLKGEKIE